MKAIWGIAVLLTACASAHEGSRPGASSSAKGVSASVASKASAAAVVVPASASPEAVVSAKAGVVETDAATLKQLGGTYLCDQRVYAKGSGGHISAWEWAFDSAPAELADKLARALPGSEREDRTFRFKGGSGEIDVVVSVESADKSTIGCSSIPKSAKSLVLASRR